VEDPVDLLDEVGNGSVGEIGFDELEVRPRPGLVEVRLLQRARIVVGEGVDAENLVASLEEGFDEVRADESGAARDEVPADGVSS
jgi:hypothetical protein